jgi:hypothetical protein
MVVRKLRGLISGVGKGVWPLCWCEESAPHILLNWQTTKRYREKYLGKKWLHMNDVVAIKNLVRCSKTTDLRQLGTFLYKVRCKWGHHTKQSDGEEEVLWSL